ncbi:DUF5315 domain-containing protein [Aspergillus candidus]|uniref:Uncharacterized protein n=1 Tax=Aspergillus candidus TaxID=41067 RepID=A0A2I2F5P9_ASPCN|nr:hypothetical protein BDW47DRAFT_127772 [Aspergillus candidus]PLB35886.1 hypothetical protein BDW47DRAFT_127772 [Aspergillus candidus]
MDIKSDPKMDQLRKISTQRLPPPVLFQGPPSHSASNLSLQPPTAAAAAAAAATSNGPVPGGAQPPPLPQPRPTRTRTPTYGSLDAPSLSPFISRSRTQSRGEMDRTDAIWQEMQNALSEVELSAVTSEHVFGERHSEALEDLRTQQLKLAQAWARSEADDEVVEPKADAVKDLSRKDAEPATTAAAAAASAGAGVATADAGAAPRNLDEETEKDILLARERREANDRYFDRVNNGVLDVVARLEEVALAMRAVERESMDVWSDSDSSSTPTESTANNAGAG